MPLISTVKVSIPSYLVVETAEPEFVGKTNEDLLQWALDMQLALRACNADKAAIRRCMEVTDAK